MDQTLSRRPEGGREESGYMRLGKSRIEASRSRVGLFQWLVPQVVPLAMSTIFLTLKNHLIYMLHNVAIIE